MNENPELNRLARMLMRYKKRENGAVRAVRAARTYTRNMAATDPRPSWVDALANAHPAYEEEACQEAKADLDIWLEEQDIIGKYGEGGE